MNQNLNSNEKRILKDVIKIMKNPLTSQGIYYKHNDDDLYKAHCMIIAPHDSIYGHGFYFFNINYPKDYPFSPPKFEYKTNNDNIRFNPNLYRNGKVCLSILNTWSGPKWSSCQTISSVLLSVLTLFHNEPLLNEPGIKKTHRDFKNYNKIIEYSTYKIAINDILSNKICSELYEIFREDIHNYIQLNSDKILDKFNLSMKKHKKGNDDIDNLVKTGIYCMKVKINYDMLKKELNKNIKDIIKLKKG